MHSLSIAAAQMDATPGPVPGRLERAAGLVVRAAGQGAQVVVLPELFNIGYQYAAGNCALAEAPDGPTLRWMKTLAAKCNIHLAGSLLLRESGDIYNSMFLIAPDGRCWRYDKSHPWGWERAYFRESRSGITVAETAFGRVGMLICWDVAHPGLWAQYAGKIDLMLVSSCPPAIDRGDLVFPDGRKVAMQALGPFWRTVYRNADSVFGSQVLGQSAWLGVPIAHCTGAGAFSSTFPRARTSALLCLAARPDLWRYLPQAARIRLCAGYFRETYVADAGGRVIQRVEHAGDGFALATVAVGESTTAPHGAQPAAGVSRLGYLTDAFAIRQMHAVYRRNLAGTERSS